MKTNKFISGIVSALLIAANIPAALPTHAAGQTYSLNGAGQHKGTGPDGYSYELWATTAHSPQSGTAQDPTETSSLAAVSTWAVPRHSSSTALSLVTLT